MAPSLRLMQRIIDAQPETSSFARAVGGGAVGKRGSGAVGTGVPGGVPKDEILMALDGQKGLLNLLVEVSWRTHFVWV